MEKFLNEIRRIFVSRVFYFGNFAHLQNNYTVNEWKYPLSGYNRICVRYMQQQHDNNIIVLLIILLYYNDNITFLW